MNFDPTELLKWVENLTPDKMALVIPFIAAYIIIRTRSLSNNWIWLICTVLGGALFVLLVPANQAKDFAEDLTYRTSAGVIYGFVAALFVLGLHGVIFKAAADKWPMLKFLVLEDDQPAADQQVRPTDNGAPRPGGTTLVVLLFALLLCNGCALVGCESAMPHPAWYWSAEAKRCRESKRMEKQLHPSTENHASRFTQGIPNLALVAPSIYRGGQPSAEGWRYLRAAGVSNVVKLNFESEGNDAPAQALGMQVGYYPISLAQQTFGEPAKANLFGAVNQIHAGTFIHCTHGQDRTGLVVAAYRVQSGWSKAEAEKEMLFHGFHPWLRGLYWAWQDYVK